MKAGCVCLLLLLPSVLGLAGAQPFDSLWVSYSNNVLGLFAIYGPQRAMLIHPPDFNLNYPFDIESLKVRFFDGMGSWTDSVFTFRILAGDGQTLLYESESLIAPHSLWFQYRLVSAVTIDSGDFYIGMAYRTYSAPYAYPFLTTDDADSTTHSFYGSPGAWQVYPWGEYFLYAYVCPCQVEVEEEPAARARPGGPATIVSGGVWLSGTGPAQLLDVFGRRAALLHPGPNDLKGVGPGAYLLRQAEFGTRKLIIQR